MTIILGLAAIFFVLGLIGILKFQGQKQATSQSQSFRETIGKVKDVELWYRVEDNFQAGDIPIFEPVTTYTYEVDGKNYTSDKGQPFDLEHLDVYTPMSKVKDQHRWILESDAYKRASTQVVSKAGDRIKVYYNPDDPSDASLTKDLEPVFQYRFITYCLMILFSFVLVYYALKGGR